MYRNRREVPEMNGWKVPQGLASDNPKARLALSIENLARLIVPYAASVGKNDDFAEKAG
jgi:hypothetical protein